MKDKLLECRDCGYVLEESKWPMMNGKKHCPSCCSVHIAKIKKEKVKP